MCCCQKKRLKRLEETIREGLGEVAKQLRMTRHVCSRPGPLSARITREFDMGLYFVISLPPIGAADTVTRQLSVAIAGGTALVSFPALEAADSEEYFGEQNDSIEAKLVDIDDVGNRSQPSVLEAVLTDTIAPQTPGALGVRVTREG